MPLTSEQQAEIDDANDVNELSQLLDDESSDFRRAVMDKGLGLVKTYSDARRLFYGAPLGTEEENRAFEKLLDVIQTQDDFEEICEYFEQNRMVFSHRIMLTDIFKKADKLGIH